MGKRKCAHVIYCLALPCIALYSHQVLPFAFRAAGQRRSIHTPPYTPLHPHPSLTPLVLATPQTLVVYMGLSTLPDFVTGLVSAGLDPDTPAVAVQDGTTSTQRAAA